MDSTDPAALAYVCFKDADNNVRPPIPRYGADGTGAVGSVYRLDQLFYLGTNSLAGTDLTDDTATIVDVEADGDTPAGARAFAMMTAATVVEKVWEEVVGSGLTISLHHPRSAAQRDLLYSLTRDLLKPPTGTPWSLRYLLRRILLRSEFNTAPGVGDEYGIDVLYNPWTVHDPRPNPPPPPDCAPDAPTYTSCIQSLVRRYSCARCHGAGSRQALDTYADMQAREFTESECEDWASDDRCQAECPTPDAAPGCNADRSLDCSSLAGNPGGRIAVVVNCTASGLRMPPGGAAMLEQDRLAILRWVTSGGEEGEPPDPMPPPTEDASGAPFPAGFFTNNGVGDAVHWKSPFQLTYSMGAALFRASDGNTIGQDPWASVMPSSTYPSLEVASNAGHYIDDSEGGSRGLSLLGVLEWERQHATAGEPCRYDGSADAIDELVSASETVEQAVRALKQRFMGENEIATAEASLLEDVIGSSLSTAVNAGNADSIGSGIRRVCNVFMKSPLFLLSYVERSSEQAANVMRERRAHAEQI